MVSKMRTIFEPLHVRYRGKYDFDGLLSLIRKFYDRSYFILREPKFKYKVGGTGAEVEFKMESDRKITHYLKAHFFVEGHFWDVDRKNGITGGKLEIKISAKLEVDYPGIFTNKDVHKWMQQTLDAPGSGLQFGDNKVTGEKYLEKLMQKLQAEIKKHLKMECV